MSINEEIARLTGKLVFDVNTSPLQRFLSMLKTAEASMARVGKSAEQMQAKLNKAFNVNSKATSAERAKQSAALQRSLDKEFTLERKHARAKEAVFKARLMQQKLVSAGTKEQVFLQNSALKSQQLAAVASAKEQQLLQQKLRTRHGEAKLAATLDQAKVRQAKLQDVLIRRQQRSQQLQRQAAKDATSLQRAEQSLIAARQRGIQLAEKHVISKAATAARESRAAERHEQQAQRFSMQQDRFQAWKTRQAEPQGGGLGSFSVGLGGAAAALYALTAAVGYASKRIEQRQAGVVEQQSFDATFQSISANPEIAKSFRNAFIDIQMKSGGAIDTETSKDFRTLAINLAETGKTQAQILDIWSTRQQAFSVAGNTKQDNVELNKQLGQMASDGTGTAADANIINNRMPMLVPHVVRAFMKENGISNYNQGLAKFNKDLKGGKGVKYSWYEEGMKSLVEANGPALERNRNSVASQQQRVDNQIYLNDNAINSDGELRLEVLDRVKALGELDTAVQPLKRSFMELDKGLTSFNTSLIRMMIGHDANGNATPNAMQKDPNPAPGSVGAALGPRLKPAPLNEQASLDDRAKPDMWNGLRRLFTGASVADDQATAQENRERWPGRIDPVELMNFDTYRLTSRDLGKDPENLADGKFRQFRPYQPYTFEDTAKAAEAQLQMRVPVQSSWLGPGDLNGATVNKPSEGNVDQSQHTEVNNNVTVNITAPPGSDEQEVGRIVRDELGKVLQTTRANQKEVE